MKVLFLCTANVNRSRTAETFFKNSFPEHEFSSAGLSEKYCNLHQTTLCTTDLLEWADRVFVMECAHLERLREYTGDKFLSKIRVLYIPDEYGYMQAELVELLKTSEAKKFLTS